MRTRVFSSLAVSPGPTVILAVLCPFTAIVLFLVDPCPWPTSCSPSPSQVSCSVCQSARPSPAPPSAHSLGRFRVSVALRLSASVYAGAFSRA